MALWTAPDDRDDTVLQEIQVEDDHIEDDDADSFSFHRLLGGEMQQSDRFDSSSSASSFPSSNQHDDRLWSNDITEFLDTNFRIIRTASTLLPILGVGLLLWQYGQFRRLKRWTDVDRHFQRLPSLKRKQFTAFVAHLQPERYRLKAYLYHVPMLERLLGVQGRSSIRGTDTLQGRLFLVRPVNSSDARLAAHQALLHRFVRVSPVDWNPTGVVSGPKSPSAVAGAEEVRPVQVFRGLFWWKRDVALALLRKGVVTVDVDSSDLVRADRRLLDSYLAAQDWAKVRGTGVWKHSGVIVRLHALTLCMKRWWAWWHSQPPTDSTSFTPSKPSS